METQVSNQPYDEAVDVSGSESEDEDTQESKPKPAAQARADSPPQTLSDNELEYNTEDEAPTNSAQMGQSQNKNKPTLNLTAGSAKPMPGTKQEQSESSSEEEEDHDDSEESPTGSNSMGYNPADYATLAVSAEIKELFQYIGRYKPHTIELETKLKPFIPDYIPAVGDIDAFIKIPRPDEKPDYLGLVVLDEPAAVQSDPTVLDLQLRAISKQSNLQPMVVRSIEQADKNPKAITTWINSINDLHKSKPAPTVNYTKNMPDIERLMQEWPDEFERLLQQVRLPTADLDVDLKAFTRIVCAVLDIPVYSNMIESLHVLFTLYSEFKSNPHFLQQAAIAMPGDGGMQASALGSNIQTMSL